MKSQEMKKWEERRQSGIGLAILAVLAVVLPLFYCRWAMTGPAGDEPSFGYCAETHLLLYPGWISLAAAFFALFSFYASLRVDRLEKEESQLKLRIDRAAKRETFRSPLLERGALEKTLPKGVPESVEVEKDFSLQSKIRDDGYEEEDSLMAFMQAEESRKRTEKLRPKRHTPRGDIYIPPGLEEAPTLFVDAGAQPIGVDQEEQRVNNPEYPHQFLDDALDQAFRMVMKYKSPVMVRVNPGVYQCTLEIPDRVTVVNHRVPSRGTVDQRLSWLREQSEIDHPDRVTILVPDKEAQGVRVLPGQKQGLIGCYLVGRTGKLQRAIHAQGSKALAIVHCAFEGFSNGAVLLEDCGEDLPGRQVLIVGTFWRGNSSPEAGGALQIRRSVVTIDASVFDSNRARCGGAIALWEGTGPLRMKRSLLHRNRALGDGTTGTPKTLSHWRDSDGLGGAIYAREAKIRLVDCILDGNDASGGGGAVAGIDSRVVLRGTESERGLCTQNRGRLGAGILLVGSGKKEALLRVEGLEILYNLATCSGGGLAAMGHALVHLEGALIEGNRADGEERGFGGGVLIFGGAKIQVRETEITANKARGCGGGIAVLNGHLSMVEGTSINRNHSEESGGGLFVASQEDKELAAYMNTPLLKLPLKIKLDGVRISENQSAQSPAGAFFGNQERQSTFPLTLAIRRPDWINENRSAAGRDQNLLVTWSLEEKGNDDTIGRLKLEFS